MTGFNITCRLVLYILSCSLLSGFWALLFVVCGLFLLYRILLKGDMYD